MHTEIEASEIKDEGEPQPGDWWIDEATGETSPCYLPDASGKLILVDFDGIPKEYFPDGPFDLNIDLFAYFEEKRALIPAIFEDYDFEEADNILSEYIKFMTDGASPAEGRLTRAAEFLFVMVNRNYMFAEMLTHLLMIEHFRPIGRQPVDENVLASDYRDFREGRAAGKTVAELHATLGKRHNINGASMKTRIKRGENIVKRSDRIFTRQYSAMIEDQIPENGPLDDDPNGLFAPRPSVRE